MECLHWALLPLEKKNRWYFLGKEISEQRNYSEKIAMRIDDEVDIVIKEAQRKAEIILIKKKNLLEKVSRVLIEKEIIEKDEYESLD
jgi:cell division protease FtsH